MKHRGDGDTLDLLADWKPEEVAVRFDREELRAATLQAKLCRAMKLALAMCGMERAEIAAKMSEYLGKPVSKAMLDAYVSEGREDHCISVERFMALVHATGDLRLIGLLADCFGLAAVPRKFVAAIEQAMIDDKIAELTRRRDEKSKTWRRR